jgi:hypothetical protein
MKMAKRTAQCIYCGSDDTYPSTLPVDDLHECRECGELFEDEEAPLRVPRKPRKWDDEEDW